MMEGNVKEKLKELTNKKSFHIVMLIIIITVIICTVGMLVLRYHVEGETNMPFTLSKISVISSCEGVDKEAVDTKWAFDVYQSNDIYLYIDKNSDYEKTEIIQSVCIDNLQVEAKEKEKIKIYRPDTEEEKVIFKNKEENRVDKLEYLGDVESDLKALKISNQGGLVAFRCSYDNLTEFKSNEEQILHTELLKKANVTLDDIKVKLTFDLTIKLESKKEYKTTITLDLPNENVIEDGVASSERTDLKEFIFKRVQK